MSHTMAPGITEISSTAEYDNIVKALPPTQLLVIDFHAVWCGPCHAIAPILERLAGQYKHVKFVKIDVDKQQLLARRFNVAAMPTFKFIKGGQQVDELRGAIPADLQKLIARHAGTPPPAGASTSAPAPARAAASSSASSSAPKTPSESSLLSSITSKELTCLNESNSHPLSSILGSGAGPKGSSYLESDVDAELLISIPFNEAVKLRAISIFSGVSPSQAPKEVKLFINQPSMDFGNAESLTPAQELDLTPEQIRGEKIELRFVRFQNVRSLHILVKSNQEDDETTRIDSIDLFGTVGDASDRGPLPKGHDHDE